MRMLRRSSDSLIFVRMAVSMRKQESGRLQVAKVFVRHAAPTNTASRVGGGDTCHALYKLPFGSLKGKGGCLSGAVLQDFKRRWRGSRVQNVDEIGMLTVLVAPN